MSDLRVDWPVVVTDVVEAFFHWPARWQMILAAIVLAYGMLPHLVGAPSSVAVSMSAGAMFFAFVLGVLYTINGVEQAIPEVLECEACAEGGESA